MPSPSRIPLPAKLRRPHTKKSKIPCATKDENAEKLLEQENVKPSKTKSVSAKATGSSQVSNKTSVLRSSENAPRTTQVKKVGDRRGISEIKRSEHNLIDKVTSLEKELKEMQNTIEESERKSNDSEKQYALLKQFADDLEHEKSDLTAEHSRLCQVLEDVNVDPVTGKSMTFSASLKSRIQFQDAKKAEDIDAIMTSLKEFDKLCDDATNSINDMVVTF